MKEQAKIACAWVRCWWYCLIRTFSKNPCMYHETSPRGRTTGIYAVTGSMHNYTLNTEKVFYRRSG